MDSFVILDDDGKMGELLTYLVRKDSGAGLNNQDADRAIAILPADKRFSPA